MLFRSLDGALVVTTTSVTNSANGLGNLYIGSTLAGTSYFFPGYITNVRIVKGTALYTPTLYPSGFTPSTTPLTNIANTSLLVNVSSNTSYITDSSSNAFTLTPTGAVAYDSASPLVGNAPVQKTDSVGNLYIDGIFDEVSPISAGSLSFNGTSNYLTFPSTAATTFGTGNFKIGRAHV